MVRLYNPKLHNKRFLYVIPMTITITNVNINNVKYWVIKPYKVKILAYILPDLRFNTLNPIRYRVMLIEKVMKIIPREP